MKLPFLVASLALAWCHLVKPLPVFAQVPEIPHGGWCQPTHEGCPGDPYIETCDSCSAMEMRNKALWAPQDQGANQVYVVDRPDREVRHYAVIVTFTSSGANKTVMEGGFPDEQSQSIKAAMEAAADVHNWFRTDAKITESDLADAGITIPHANAFDFAASPNGSLALSNAIEQYLNGELEGLSDLQQSLDQLESAVSTLISKIADIAIDSDPAVTFEWTEGGEVKARVSVVVDLDGGVTAVVEVILTTLKSANGDDVPFDLSAWGVGGGGGVTDPIYVSDPSVEDDLRDYLDYLGSLESNSCNTTELSCNGSGYCVATISC